MLGLATIAALVLPAMAQDTYCRLDRDGDSQICTTRSYDAYGNVYERRYTAPVYNGYYGNGGAYYGNGYYGSGYRSYDNDWNRRREHEEHERRERIEREQHEWREHHDGYDR